MYMCWVSILQKIWLVITYYGTSSASPQPQPRIGKIPSLALSRGCNIETNYGWNWKVTSLFCLDQTTAKRLSAEKEIPPKCFLLHYHQWHPRHFLLLVSVVDINIHFSSHNPTKKNTKWQSDWCIAKQNTGYSYSKSLWSKYDFCQYVSLTHSSH